MTLFQCPSCLKALDVVDEKASKCPKCNLPLAVPLPRQPGKPGKPGKLVVDLLSPSSQGNAATIENADRIAPRVWRPPLLLVVISALILTSLLFVLSHFESTAQRDRRAEVLRREHVQCELAELHEQIAKLAEENRVDAKRHRAAIDEQMTDLNLYKVEENCKQAAIKTSLSIEIIKHKIVRIIDEDQFSHQDIDSFDNTYMILFSEKDIDPRDDNQPVVKEFYDQRGRLVEKSKDRQSKMLSEARQVAHEMRVDSSLPVANKAEFETISTAELRRGEAILKNSYPDPLALHATAVLAVKVRRDKRKAKTRKSELAAAALIKYAENLPISSKTLIDQDDFVNIAILMKRVQWSHTVGKLSLDNDAFVELSSYLRMNKEKLRGVLTIYDEIAGDMRINHNPSWPSIAETNSELLRLISKGLIAPSNNND